MRVDFINPNLDGSPIPNLGLAYVISSIEEYHKVRLLDMGFHAKRYQDYIIGRLKESRPDVIGMSVTSFSFRYALKIAAIIKKLYPDIPLVYGGVHPTLLPEETIQNPLVDAICIGEGEDSFKEYLDRLKNNRSPEGVAGIWYKDKPGEVVRNPLRPFREDLDSLPFPNWDYWDIKRYLMTNLYFVGSIAHMFSRGCPYSCSFCSSPAIKRAVPGQFYRQRSPENIIVEIKNNKAKYFHIGFRNVVFADATFGVDMDRMKEICHLYMEENLHIDLPWVCQTRAELITEEWAQLIGKAGCCMVSLGVESGNDYIRAQVLKKEMTKKEILNATRILRENNIMYSFNIMLGCPEETRDTLRETMAIIKLAKPLNSYFSFYQPLPKTELGERSKARIIISEEKIKKAWNTPRIALESMGVYELKNVMLGIRIHKVCKFFLAGIKLKGVGFIMTVIKYIFSIGGYRTMSLMNPYMEIDLEQRTLYPYILENWKRDFLKNLPGMQTYNTRK